MSSAVPFGYNDPYRMFSGGLVMILDRDLLEEPPKYNYIIGNGFKKFPVYARQELLFSHKQRLHTQPGIEINLTLEGKAHYVIGKQIYTQTPGQLMVLSGIVPHQVYIDPSCHYKRAVVCFDEAELRKRKEFQLLASVNLSLLSAHTCQKVIPEPEMFQNIKWIILRLSEELQEKAHGWNQATASLLAALTVFIQRSMQLQKSAVEVNLVSQCCEYVNNHLTEKLSLSQVARIFHISPEHLIRQFKRKTGLTFYQYVLQQRVSESKRMLRNCPEMSITEIAYAAGFSSAAHFSRIFRHSTGLLPSQYRNQKPPDL